jgi:hypothetical protein
MSVFKQWMAAATVAEQKELARLAGTSRMYLYHIAADETTRYRRIPRRGLAQRLATACESLRRGSKGRLPRVLASDLNPALANAEQSGEHLTA